LGLKSWLLYLTLYLTFNIPSNASDQLPNTTVTSRWLRFQL